MAKANFDFAAISAAPKREKGKRSDGSLAGDCSEFIRSIDELMKLLPKAKQAAEAAQAGASNCPEAKAKALAERLGHGQIYLNLAKPSNRGNQALRELIRAAGLDS